LDAPVGCGGEASEVRKRAARQRAVAVAAFEDTQQPPAREAVGEASRIRRKSMVKGRRDFTPMT
jgi:hypothetical protein